jgi:hypothetical protein
LHSYDEAQGRIPNQKEKIINALKDAGENGLTNSQLNKICYRYGARLSELYEKGYEIEIEAKEKGVYKYILKKTPSEEKFFPNANEEIFETVKKDYDDQISSTQLKFLLQKKGFNIHRKYGWYKNNMKIN